MIHNSEINHLRLLTTQLQVFSPDSVDLIRQTLPKARFKSGLIDQLVKSKDSLLTRSIADKFQSVKAGLVAYLEEKIQAIESASEEEDPWTILKDRLAGTIDVSSKGIHDHLLDVLRASQLVAEHEFSLGAAAQSDEILGLRSALAQSYIPALDSLPPSETKEKLLKEVEAIDAHLQVMNAKLRVKSYAETLASYERVREAVRNSCLLAHAYQEASEFFASSPKSKG